MSQLRELNLQTITAGDKQKSLGGTVKSHLCDKQTGPYVG